MSANTYLNIFNVKNASILQEPLSEFHEPELTEFRLFSLSGLEVFLNHCERNYYNDLETYGNMHSSLLLTPSGIKILLVHKNLTKSAAKRILYNIHNILREMSTNPVKYGFVNERLYQDALNIVKNAAVNSFKDEISED